MNNIEEMINSVMNDPEQMKKVMDMAGSIMGNTGSAAPEAGSGAPSGGGLGLDSILSGLSKLPGGLAGAASSLFGGGGGSSAVGVSGDKTELLEAMKPWLSEKRRAKLDGAMKIARVMKNAGSTFFGRGGSA